jgi:hypothetical protein
MFVDSKTFKEIFGPHHLTHILRYSPKSNMITISEVKPKLRTEKIELFHKPVINPSKLFKEPFLS